MSSCVNIRVKNKTAYTLTKYQIWGEPWSGTEPPTRIAARGTSCFNLDNNNRAGVIFLATDANGNEMGFVTMSFVCAKNSCNSAEGSPDKPGTFISAGLQAYEEHGTTISIEYNVGESNLACWGNGGSDNGVIECDETRLQKWARALVSVDNTTANTLEHVGNWGANWVKAPVSIPAKGRRIFLLNDNDRSGIYFKVVDSSQHALGHVTMSMTCPYNSSNSADGSKKTSHIFLDAGLQSYEENYVPASFVYKVGQPNRASWASGSSIGETIDCKQDSLDSGAKTAVVNDNDYDLEWNRKVGS